MNSAYVYLVCSPASPSSVQIGVSNSQTNAHMDSGFNVSYDLTNGAPTKPQVAADFVAYWNNLFPDDPIQITDTLLFNFPEFTPAA